MTGEITMTHYEKNVVKAWGALCAMFGAYRMKNAKLIVSAQEAENRKGLPAELFCRSAKQEARKILVLQICYGIRYSDICFPQKLREEFLYMKNAESIKALRHATKLLPRKVL